MPKPPIAPHWVERVRVLAETEPHLSGKQIEDRLKAEAGDRKDYPAERKIRDIKRLHVAAQPEDRQLYAYVRWPQSFEHGALPWEASAVVLDLLRNYPEAKRPTHRLAHWFWRITQAAPDCPFAWRYYLARTMVADQVMAPGAGKRRLAELAESILRHAEWRTSKPVPLPEVLPTDHLWLAGLGDPNVIDETVPPGEGELLKELITLIRESPPGGERHKALIAVLPTALKYGNTIAESDGEDDDDGR